MDTREGGEVSFKILSELLASVQPADLQSEPAGHRHMDRNYPRNGRRSLYMPVGRRQ